MKESTREVIRRNRELEPKAYISERTLEWILTNIHTGRNEKGEFDFSDNNVSYKIFQRRLGAWDIKKEREWIKSIINGVQMFEPLYYIDANQVVKQSNCLDTILTFSIIKEFHDHESIDEQHRMSTFKRYLTNQFWVNINGEKLYYSDLDENQKRTILESKYQVVTYTSGTIRQFANKFKVFNTTSSKLILQEILNSLRTAFHEEGIKPLALDNFSWINKHILRKSGDFSYSKMGEYWFLNYILNIIEHDRVNAKDITKFYTDNETRLIPILELYLKKFKKVFKVMSDRGISGKVDNSFFSGLTMLFKYMFEVGDKIEDFDSFYSWWSNSESLRRSNISLLLNDKGQNYETLCRGISSVKDNKLRLDVIIHDYLKSNDKGVVTLHNERNFTKLDRILIYHRDEGRYRQNGCINGVWFKDPELLPEYDYVKSIDEILNNPNYTIDHIDPYTLGFETSLENGELATSEFNNWKRAKFPNDKVNPNLH
jgi:hypothetical protein